MDLVRRSSAREALKKVVWNRYSISPTAVSGAAEQPRVLEVAYRPKPKTTYGC